jgi:hypothetical protein
MDLAMVLHGREFTSLAKPFRPGGAYALERRQPDPPKAIPLAPRFTENLAQTWVHLLTNSDVEAQGQCESSLRDHVVPTEGFAHATLPCRPTIMIKDLRWEADTFPLEVKPIPLTMPLAQKDFVHWFTRVREITNLASNLEYPVAMLEALAQETPNPNAPAREEGPWMALVNPYVQAAKDNLEALQKVAAEALVQATIFGRDALLTTVKVGLV